MFKRMLAVFISYTSTAVIALCPLISEYGNINHASTNTGISSEFHFDLNTRNVFGEIKQYYDLKKYSV